MVHLAERGHHPFDPQHRGRRGVGGGRSGLDCRPAGGRAPVAPRSPWTARPWAVPARRTGPRRTCWRPAPTPATGCQRWCWRKARSPARPAFPARYRHPAPHQRGRLRPKMNGNQPGLRTAITSSCASTGHPGTTPAPAARGAPNNASSTSWPPPGSTSPGATQVFLRTTAAAPSPARSWAPLTTATGPGPSLTPARFRRPGARPVTVAASNGVGTGAASAAADLTPRMVPSVVTLRRRRRPRWAP